MLNGYLYIAWSNGTFDRRTFDGTTYGAAEAVDTASKLTALTDWTSDITSDDRAVLRLGSPLLHQERLQHALLPLLHAGEQGRRRAAAHRQRQRGRHRLLPGPRHVRRRRQPLLVRPRPATCAGSAGRRVHSPARPVAGVATVVSSPALDGYNWASPRALFLFQDADGDGPAQTPVASFASSCTSLTCAFDSSGSSVQGATITGSRWNFGDGTTSTEPTPSTRTPPPAPTRSASP